MNRGGKIQERDELIQNFILIYFMKLINMSRAMRKPDFCLCENKGADQLRSYCEADQRLCFRFTDSTIRLVLKSEISSFQPPSVAAQAGLCETWSETPKTGFLASRLISFFTERQVAVPSGQNKKMA